MDFPDLILITMYILIGSVISFLAASFWQKVITKPSFKVEIIDGEIKGADKDLKRLEIYGGPGQLIVYPRQVVVLQHQGRITREVGAGITFLYSDEKIKTIFPLTPQGGVQTLENVLTRDGIPLVVQVLHVAQVELANDTRVHFETNAPEGKSRSAELYHRLLDDAIIGDEYDQCYGSVARLVAMKAPGIWQAMKHSVAIDVKKKILN